MHAALLSVNHLLPMQIYIRSVQEVYTLLFLMHSCSCLSLRMPQLSSLSILFQPASRYSASDPDAKPPLPSSFSWSVFVPTSHCSACAASPILLSPPITLPLFHSPFSAENLQLINKSQPSRPGSIKGTSVFDSCHLFDSLMCGRSRAQTVSQLYVCQHNSTEPIIITPSWLNWVGFLRTCSADKHLKHQSPFAALCHSLSSFPSVLELLHLFLNV